MTDHEGVGPSQGTALQWNPAAPPGLGRAFRNHHGGTRLIGLEIGVHLQTVAVARLDGHLQRIAQLPASQFEVLPIIVAASGRDRVSAVSIAVVCPSHSSYAQLRETLHHGIDVFGRDGNRRSQGVIGEIHQCL